MFFSRPFFKLLTSIAMILCCQLSFAASLVGKKLPAFSIPTLNGNMMMTNKEFCGHVSLLNIWASWCSACQHEHPVLMNIKKQGKVTIYGINFEDDAGSALNWVNTAGNPYRMIGVDKNGDLSDRLNVTGLPQTFIIDGNGVVRYSYSGFLTPRTWQKYLAPVVAQLRAHPNNNHGVC